MTKRQLIDEIVELNRTAEPGFLAQFKDQDLNEYLAHLRRCRQPRLTGDASIYEKYFKPSTPRQAPARPADATQHDDRRTLVAAGASLF